MADHTGIYDNYDTPSPPRCMWVNGPIIVGAGPSGLAVAASLKERGVPYVILERSDCVASLWQKRTYDRLRLHLPKQFCQLPGLPFPDGYPEYPSRNQFVRYLESYATHFDIVPRFNRAVRSARYDKADGLWRVKAADKTAAGDEEEVETYIGRWLVVATGENAERVVPDFKGMGAFGGEVTHVCDYKSGEGYRGKKVLVVGCGNSGMEVCLDLCEHDAHPSMVVRDSFHVLPREVLGRSTFDLAVLLMKWLPLWLVDRMLLAVARLVLGNVDKYGLKRPSAGPLQLKNTLGRTPVLDVGALDKIKSGEIEVVAGVKEFLPRRVELVDGRVLDIDSVVLATGYCSNVPSWLQETDFFSKDCFPNSWKGKCGLYVAGFTRRGLAGASSDAVRIAKDLGEAWAEQMKQANNFVCIEQAPSPGNGRSAPCWDEA